MRAFAAKPAEDQTIHDLISRQAKERGDAVALVSDGHTVTYRELDLRASALARRITAIGIAPGAIIGLHLPRGADLVVAMLGVLKAGGAYLSIDPSSPADYVLPLFKQSVITAVIEGPYSATLSARLGVDTELFVSRIETGSVALDIPPLAGGPSLPSVTADDPACVLLTSGTTGPAKAVMFPHRATVETFFGQDFMSFGPEETFLQHSPISWDGFSLELWSVLLHGGTSVLAPPGTVDAESIASLTQRYHVTSLFLTAELFQVVVEDYPHCLRDVRQVMTGGDVVTAAALNAARHNSPQLQVIHGYGPVESMVVVCTHTVEDADRGRSRVPIGSPLWGSDLFILNAQLEPVADGEVGELYVGGSRLSWGYAAQTAITAEKFIPRPGGNGERLYATGDLVRMSERELEFIGRRDHQVKIRGVRVEPDGVAAVLQQHPHVRRTVVMARGDIAPKRQLIAYVVPEIDGVSEQELLDYVSARMPGAMVPSAVVFLTQIPATPTGKIDRSALPPPAPREPARLPESDVELVIARVWCDVLGKEDIGVDDDFFRLGGDSISVMQIVARLRSHGWHIDGPSFFEHRTISNLARQVVSVGITPDRAQPAYSGEIPLTPIQLWLLEHQSRGSAAVYQQVKVRFESDLDVATLQTAFDGLFRRHDALRCYFTVDEDGRWHQFIRDSDTSTNGFITIDTVAADEQNLTAPFDLATAPLIRVAITGYNEVTVVAHHLIVDAVSWRVMMEDLSALYSNVPPAPATSSFAEWADGLATFAFDSATVFDRNRWNVIMRAAPALPCAGQIQASSEVPKCIRVSLDPPTSRRLLESADATAHEYLIAALGLALNGLDGIKHRSIDIERHGRAQIADHIDVSRTVGWFTSIFPITLPTAEGTAQYLSEVKDVFAQIKREGIDYGILRYLRQEVDQPATTQPTLCVNFLGGLAEGVGSETPGLTWRREIGGRRHLSHPVSVVSWFENGRLVLTVDYAPELYADALVESLARGCIRMLKELLPEDLGTRQANARTMSPAQLGMALSSLRGDRPGSYIEQRCWSIPRGMVERFVYAVNVAAHRHDALRQYVVTRPGDAPRVAFAEECEIPVRFELCNSRDTEIGASLEHILAEDRAAGFDLNCPPLIRILVLDAGCDDLNVVLTHHHLILDGWSMNLLLTEIEALLDEPRVVEQSKAPSFTAFLSWLEHRDPVSARHHWERQLAGAPETFLGRPPAPGSLNSYRQKVFRLGVTHSEEVRRMAQRDGLTLSTVVHGCFGLALSTLTRQREVVFATTGALRPSELANIEHMVGPLIDTVPMRVSFDVEVPSVEWLNNLQRTIVQQRELAPILLDSLLHGDSSAGLFDTAIAFENLPRLVNGLRYGGGLVDESDNAIPARTQPEYALTLIVKPSENISLKFVYDEARVDEQRVTDLAALIMATLPQICRMPDRPIAEMPLLRDAKRPVAETRSNKKSKDSPSVPEMFKQQVTAGSQRVAVISGSKNVSYAELAERADEIAAILTTRGLQKTDVIGVCMPRSVDMVATVLAVLNLGAVYVPVDFADPPLRRRLLMRNIGARAVVVNPGAENDWAGEVDVIMAPAAQHPKSPPLRYRPPAVDPTDVAYIVHTSGSTGSPKGVAVTHRSLSNRLQWMCTEYPVHNDAVLLKTPCNFDVAVWELLWPLCNGASLAIAPSGAERDAVSLDAAIHDSQCSVLHFVPSALDAFLDARQSSFDCVRLLVCSGERLPAPLAQRLPERFPNALFYNLYGPTEATIDATFFEISVCGSADPAIGQPITNMQTYVLDPVGREVPDNVIGELFLAGVGLALGYIHNPAGTAERFLPNPFADGGSRMYRTGDLVLRSSDGLLHYKGRVDDQIKIRGLRIELGEIEAALRAQDTIRDAAVVAVGEDHRHRQIMAFVVAADAAIETELFENRLRDGLSAMLPRYMVPSAFTVVDALPLTPSGKLDRRKLSQSGKAVASSPIKPRNSTEKAVAFVWQEVLSLNDIGVHDDFYALGGNSLAAMKIAGLIGQQFGVDLTVGVAFLTPTVAAMAELVDTLQPHSGARPQRVPQHDANCSVSPAQHAMWLMAISSPDDPYYNVPIVTSIEGTLDAAALWSAINSLIARHPALRTRFVASDDGVPRQVVDEFAGCTMPVDDIGAVADEVVHGLVRNEALRSFDVAQAPLLRCRLLRLDAERNVLILTLHHIITDAWSNAILVRDLWTLYESHRTGESPQLPELHVRYTDYTVWLLRRMSSSAGSKLRAYWHGAVDGVQELRALPGAPAETLASARHRGRELTVPITTSTVESLDALAGRHNATLFMIVLASLHALLHQWTSEETVVVGVPTANRVTAEVTDVVGLFANVVPIASVCHRDSVFSAFLDTVRDTALAAYANQEFPFDRIVEERSPTRRSGSTPYIRVIAQELPAEFADLSRVSKNLVLNRLSPDVETSRFDLSLSYRRTHDNSLRIKLTYSLNALREDVAEAFAECIGHVLAEIAVDPDRLISEIYAPATAAVSSAVNTNNNEPLGATSVSTDTDRLRLALRGHWSSLLDIAEIADGDDFFELGGNSLLAAQLRARILRDLGVEVPMDTIFEHPTFVDLLHQTAVLSRTPPVKTLPPIRPRRR